MALRSHVVKFPPKFGGNYNALVQDTVTGEFICKVRNTRLSAQKWAKQVKRGER